MDLKKVFEVLEEVSGTRSRNEKVTILRENVSDDMAFVLETFLNPFLTYGVHAFDDGKVYRNDIPQVDELKSLRHELATRELTGGLAKETLRQTLLCEDELVKKWLVKLFRKDLRTGFSGDVVNKIYPDLIPKFVVGLCGALPEDAKEIPEGLWYIEPKFDGLRVMAFIDEKGEVTFVSRNGKPIYNTYVIEEQIKLLGLKNLVLDGEFLAKDWNKSISLAHTQSERPREEVENLMYYVFDILHKSEWDSKKSDKLSVRKERLLNYLLGGTNNIVAVMGTVVSQPRISSSRPGAREIYEQLLSEGYEGAVIKLVDSEYPFGRGGAWRKWKPVITIDLKVVAVTEGTGRNKGKLGALVVKYKDRTINVGGGYSDELRIEYWEKKEEMIGKIIEIKAQEVTKDNSLRFPRFLRLRVDKDEMNEEVGGMVIKVTVQELIDKDCLAELIILRGYDNEAAAERADAAVELELTLDEAKEIGLV